MNEGKVVGQEIVADDARYLGPPNSRELPRGLLQFLRPHIVRRGVDEIAPEPDRIHLSQDARMIDAAWRLELRGLVASGRLVTPEAIGAEPPGDGGEFRLGNVVGQMVA